MLSNSPAPEDTAVDSDLGPLAWVLDELRKSLDGATKAVRRFVRDAEMARGSELTELDTSHLRVARTQLHQAVGALEMVGMQAPAKMLHAMEALAQKFVQRPESCSEEAATAVERASFALTEFLEGVLKGKHASPVALFPQYRAIMAQAGAERIHPSDLWPAEWRWQTVEPMGSVAAQPYAAEVRTRMDRAVLQIVKTGDAKAAARMVGYCAGLSAALGAGSERSFWAMASGYFEALGLGLLPLDIYTKRTSSRILQQYAALAKGGQAPSEQLAQELVFFCALAQAPQGKSAPALAAVRHAYGLDNFKAVDYETEQFGRFDPAQLVLARKRISSAAETWSALAGGDVNRLKVVGEQFAAVTESIVKLHPESSALAHALTAAIESVIKSGAAPNPAVAMEVATAILYLEAAYEDLDPTDNHMAERGGRLALRLQHVCAGSEPEPLEAWMEELYRRVSDRQTMGSVVDELRASLADVEKSLDLFFRNPGDKSPLTEVPGRLAQMRGVFSVLGLDQPSTAALRMRASVEQFLIDDIDVESARSGIFEKIGNSLGAMGFLIDMLSYQRSMAKKLFVYDEALGEFKPLMGRGRGAELPPAGLDVTAAAGADVQADTQHVKTVVLQAPLAPQASPVPAATLSSASPSAASPATDAQDDDDDADLQDIFLEEAREVVQNGLAAAHALTEDPANLADQTTLRRAFHTLKGSSRMVGLHEFGEAAWSFEQLLNAWLAEQKPASDELIHLASSAMRELGSWVEDIAHKRDVEWSAVEFRKSSDAMRLDHVFVPLRGPVSAPGPALAPAPAPAEVEPPPDFASTQFFTPALAPGLQDEATRAAPLQDFAATSLVDSLDFGVPAPRQDFASTQIAGGNTNDFENTRSSSLEETLSHSKQPVMPELDLGGFDVEEVTAEVPDFDDDLDGAPLFTEEDRVSVLQALGELDKIDAMDASESVFAPDAAEQSDALIELEFPQAQETQASADAKPDPESGPESEIQLDSLLSDLVAEEAPAEAPVATPVPVEVPALAAVEAQDEDEQVKVIGHLRLSIPFYNVYLNEADEWSRRLQTELNEWALELHRPVPRTAISLAHSLLGSSATVGFQALSTVARALEHALEHVQLHEQGTAEHAAVFNNAAEDIRRLLHQFAAGFLKECDAGVLQALQDIIDTEFPAPTTASDSLLSEDELAELDDADQETLMPDLEPTAPEALAVFSQEDAPVAEAAASAANEAPHVNVVPLMAAAPLKVARSGDDDIDAHDSLDPDLFPIFQEEALELMPALGAALRQWVARPDNLSARGETLRVLHTLKGSARLAGAMRLGEMAHRMESSIEELGSEGLQAVQLEPLLTRFDAVQATLDGLGKEVPAEGVEVSHAAEQDTPAKPALTEAAKRPATSSAVDAAVSTVIKMAASSAVLAPATRNLAGQSVRVRSQLLDRLVNQAGEVMMSRSRLDSRLTQLRTSMSELTGNLDRLRQQLRDVELQAESQMQTRLAQSKDTAQGFDPLEFDRFTRVQELTRMMAESVNDVATVQRNIQRSVEGAEDDLIAQGRQARELQRDLLRTRMVEFEGISDRLYGVVRQAAKEAGKQVKLDIVGGSIEMDRGVLDRMTPPFEHILRNAVAHGIESAEVRTQAGKPAAGTITITVHQESNDVSVAFSDDGGGLHIERIRAKALARNLIAPDDELTDAVAANLLFAPGFSTAEQVTELSGRGIGMDVVLSEVNALGGRIETSTVRGQGTRFQLVLPLTTAVTQVVMLRMGEFTIGVPSNLMETVLRSPAAALHDAYVRNVYDMAGQDIPFYWAGALLQVSGRSVEPATKHYPVAIFRSAGQRLALHVDEVLGNREVVVKNLGPQLARLPGLAGMSVLASGAVVLIYNPVALATVYGEQALALQVAAGAQATATADDVPPKTAAIAAAVPGSAGEPLPLVLVVDDSITVRRVTQRLLKREGFRVLTANDGLDALEKLAQEKPDVVLSDIEMPRMDGFDLARNIRADARLADLPIIMITSRIAQKHRVHATALGVNHYLGKPYSEDVLLGLIRQYCGTNAEA